MAWSSTNGRNSSAAHLCERRMLHLHLSHEWRLINIATFGCHLCSIYIWHTGQQQIMYAARKWRENGEQERLHMKASLSKD